jgi:hypothetical protein
MLNREHFGKSLSAGLNLMPADWILPLQDATAESLPSSGAKHSDTIGEHQ